ncbi:MAG: preprotein translocase subunit SecE [Bacteroidia bacterium]|nr:preprotein translocase subunit SecE [Bacteroidia bacterium]MDW8302121.1 preprotein translocase subunit SecE [Bacteroidia bacterium]
MLEKIRNWYKEIYNELVNKVSWPTWEELQGSTTVVLVACLIISIIVFIVDTVFNYGLQFIYGG